MTRIEQRIFLAFVVLVTAMVSRGPHSIDGGAPHYLALSHSLVYDFDVDLSNQYDADSAYIFRRAVSSDYVRPGRQGGLYLTDGVGFAVAVAPAFLVADRITAFVPESVLEKVRWNRERACRDLLSFLMALLYAWTAILTLRLTEALCGSKARTLWSTVIAFATPPLLGVSFLVFPAIPAASLCLLFALEQLRPRPRPSVLLAPLVLLPWLQARFAIISAAGLIWIVARERSRGRDWLRRSARSVTLPLGSMALVLVARLGTFGLDWWDGWITQTTGVALRSGGTLGLMLNPDHGLLLLAPLWFVTVAGIPSVRRAHAGHLGFASGAFVAIWAFAGLTDARWRMFLPPALILVPVLPLLVPLLSEGFGRVSRGWVRWPAYGVVGWGVLMTASLVDRPARVWTLPGAGLSRSLAPAIDLLSRSGRARWQLEWAGIGVEAGSLVRAVEAGDLETVCQLLAAGMDPRPVLVDAAGRDRVEVLEALLLTDVRTDFERGRALAWAGPASAAMLEAAGADIDVRNAFDQTPLVVAAKSGWAEEVDRLLRAGASVDAAARTGKTALMVATEAGHVDALSLLLAAGANVDTRDRDGWTPVMAATRSGRVEQVGMLIAVGADVNATSDLGWTALMWAAYDGHVDLVRLLLDTGADPNQVSHAGTTALIRAASHGHLASVDALLSGGADVRLVSDGLDARTAAARAGHDEVAARLERAAQDRSDEEEWRNR